MAEGIPDELVALAEQHCRAVLEGDTARVISDFRPDRVGQLRAATKLPPGLVSARLLHLAPDGAGLVADITRYTAADATEAVLRTRWLKVSRGWVINEVRNLPATPPYLPDTGPAKDGLDARYWEGLRDGELRLPCCDRCATWIWPVRAICPRCHSFAMTWAPVAPTGTVFSWIRTWHAFVPEFSGHLPFVTVLAQLPHAGDRRLLGALLDADGVDPELGQRVDGEITPPSERGEWPVLRWRLR